MNLKPSGKKLLVEIQEGKKRSLLLVTANKDEPKKVMVLCLGDKTEIKAEVGNLLLINPYAGRKICTEKEYEKIMIIEDHDVIGIIQD